MKFIYTFLYLLICGLTVSAQPTDNATEPPIRDAGDVIGIYGDAYTNVAGINYDPNWGQSGHMLVNPAFDPGTGQVILAYPNFNYQGTDFESTPQNASLMENLHVDIWVPAGTDRLVKVSPIDNSGTGAGETLVEVPLVPGSWNSVDLPKSSFTGMTWNSVFQLKFDGQFNGDGSANTDPFDIYLDNIYFWKTPTATGTDATLSDLQVDGTTISGFGSGITEYNYGLPGGTMTVPQITMATQTDPGATVSITQATAIPGVGTVEVTSANGMEMLTYSVSFFVSVPSTSPPSPTNAQEDVISIYGEAFTNVSGIDYDPNWGQSGHMQVNPSFDPGTANLALAYPNFNYQGTEFSENPQNASEMEFLHVDIWVAEGTERLVKITPIDNSGVGAPEILVEVPFTPGSWNSVDLPKSAFADMSWNSVIQLKFDGQFNPDGSANQSSYDIYLDNIYFWKEAVSAGVEATLSDLQIDGTTVAGFDPTVTSYSVGLPGGTMTIPQVTATTTDATATSTITQATAIPGDATVDVTSGNGMNMLTYTVSYFYASPTEGAPDPSDLEENVISLFSDAYNDVDVDTWNTVWSDAMFEEVMVDGNPTKLYTDLGFNGIETVASPVDASGMMNLNMDIWSPNMDEIKVKIVDFLGDGFQGANGDTEAELTFPVTKGEWMSLSIPLEDFSNAGMTAFSDLNQYIISSVPFGTGILYVDNVYFSRLPSSSQDVLESERIQVYPNPVAVGGVLIISESVKSIEIMSIQGQVLRKSVNTSISMTGLPAGTYLARITSLEGNKQVTKVIVK